MYEYCVNSTPVQVQYPVSWCARAWVSEGKWKRGLDLPWEKLCRKRATPAAAAAVPTLEGATDIIFNLKINGKKIEIKQYFCADYLENQICNSWDVDLWIFSAGNFSIIKSISNQAHVTQSHWQHLKRCQ